MLGFTGEEAPFSTWTQIQVNIYIRTRILHNIPMIYDAPNSFKYIYTTRNWSSNDLVFFLYVSFEWRFPFENASDNSLRAYSSDFTDRFGNSLSLSLSVCLYTHIHTYTYIYIYIHIFTFEHSSIKYAKSLDYFKSLWRCGLRLWCFHCDVQVRDIPCGTKGGVMINFEKIEVMFLILPSFPAKSCVWLVNA